MSQIWKPVAGFDGDYAGSSLGNVRSFKTSKQLKPCIGSSGYPQVDLCKQGKKRSLTIHQLVAKAFLGGIPDGMVVCHKDGNKLNRCVDNLRVDTQDSNNKDKVRHGVTARGEQIIHSKLNQESVIEIRKLAASGIRHKKIAEQFGVSRPAVSSVVRGDTWKHIGTMQ